MNKDIHIEAHALSINNKSLILESNRCGCFYCKKMFDPDKINEWIKDKLDETAVCPFCNIDSVIPETEDIKIDEELLQNMRNYWFYPE